MNKIIVALLIIFVAADCSHENSNKCYQGTIIMSSCCTGSTFINLNTSWPLGVKTKINGTEYQNVIQVPGYLDKENTNTIYLSLRPFDRDHDQNLYPPIQCYCLMAIGLDVPVFVATAHSYTSCQQQDN
ncbi:MAG: hypothetical protein QM734_16930 [Cyclobacteriaceae bacterium]